MKRSVLALDVGGTNLRLAEVTADGSIIKPRILQADLSHLQAASPEEAGKRVVDILAAAIRERMMQCAGIGAIGIGFPGFFRRASGILVASPNIPQLHEFPLVAALARRLPRPVFIHNDATLAALGEHRYGTGKGKAGLLHLTLGTGVGGGLILHGGIHDGESGMAAEIGHLCVRPGGRPCGCGGRGCLEAYASATAVRDRYREKGKAVKDAKEVFQRAKDGDVAAGRLFEEAGAALGLAIAQAVLLLDIHHVSLSGGLTGAWEYLSTPLQSNLNAHLIAPQKNSVRVCRSILGDHAGLLGAAALAFDGLQR